MMTHQHVHITIDRPMPESVKKAMKDKSEQWAARIAAARANQSNDNLQNVPPAADRP